VHASGRPIEHDLSWRLADLARDVQCQPGDAAVMDVVVAAAVSTRRRAEGASISLVRRGRHVVSAAATGDVPRRFDALQEETRQGPCIDAMSEHETIRVDDLAGEQRWPELVQGWCAGAEHPAEDCRSGCRSNRHSRTPPGRSLLPSAFAGDVLQP
jgi:hypothetical protein